MANTLVKCRANLDIEDFGKLTPLQRCALQCVGKSLSFDTAKILIDAGANVNVDPPILTLLAQRDDQEPEELCEFANLIIRHPQKTNIVKEVENALEVLIERKEQLEKNELGLYELLSEFHENQNKNYNKNARKQSPGK